MSFFQSNAKQSLTRQTLLKIAGRIAVVIVVTAIISYYHIMAVMQTQTLEHLQKYVSERTLHERAIFTLDLLQEYSEMNFSCRSRSAVPCFALSRQENFVRRTAVFESGTFLYPTYARGLLAEDNHALLKKELIERVGQPDAKISASQFDNLYVRYPDGVVRNRKKGFDGKKQAGVYIDKSLPLTDTLRRRILLFSNLCEKYGAAWHNRFQDTYLTTPENVSWYCIGPKSRHGRTMPKPT